MPAYVHGSRNDVPVGTVLTPRPDYLADWGGSFVYQTLEEHRPPDCLPHERSVFMVSAENEDDIVHAGGPRSGWKLTLDPLDRVETHNLVWLDAIFEHCCGAEEEDAALVAELARRYWRGVPHDTLPDTWEYVTTAAEVVRSVEYDVDGPCRRP